MLRLVSALALVAVLGGCRSSAPTAPPVPSASAPLADRIVGRWTMERVLERGRDVTETHNPAGDRYVVLRADRTFESGGEPYGRNAGRWTLDPGYNELTLDSDLGDADDTSWIVALEGDRMEWAGVGTPTARRFRILSQRAD